MRYLIAADASVLNYQGLGWAIIQDLDTGVIRHKAICRKLVKKNASTLMELITVHSVFLSLPNDISVELVNDCQMLHDLYFWESVNWLNSRKILSLESKQLRDIYRLAQDKNISFVVKDKTTHPFHSECDLNCHRFREEISRAGKMYQLFTLTPEYKAKYESSHYSLVKAQSKAHQIGRTRAAMNLPKLPTIIAMCKNPSKTVKDLKGHVYELVE